MANEYVITAQYVEHIASYSGDVRVSSLSVEVIANYPNILRVSALPVEVIMSVREGINYNPPFIDESDEIFSPETWEQGTQNVNVGFLFESDLIYPLQILQSVAPPLPAEWNPYRPDVPIQLEQDSDVYDYMRHQAETIREQHDLTQAGDSTFPWQMTAQRGESKAFTLGSISRFYHEDYGIMFGKYVYFTKDMSSRHNPVGLLVEDDLYHVTDVIADSASVDVVGIATRFGQDTGESWGWALIEGLNPFQLFIQARTPTKDTRLTWIRDGVLSVGDGPQVARVYNPEMLVELENQPDDETRLWEAPPGSVYVNVSGFTDEYIKARATEATAALEVRVSALETAIEEEAVDYTSTIQGLTDGLEAISQQLNFESQSRQQTDQSLVNRVYNLETALAGIGDAEDAASLAIRLSAVESLAEEIDNELSAFKPAVNTRLGIIESNYASLSNQMDGYTGVISNLTGRINTLTLDSLTDVDLTTTPPVDGNAILFDEADGLWKPGVVAAGGGGGGGGGGLELIQEFVAVGGETSVVLAAIPQTFEELRIVYSLKNVVSNAIVGVRYNGDATAVYDRFRHYGGRAGGSDQSVSQTQFTNLSTLNPSVFAEGYIEIPGYTRDDRPKSIHNQGWQSHALLNNEGYIINLSGKWRNNAPVTQVELLLDTDSLAAGSTVKLYGIPLSSGGAGGTPSGDAFPASPTLGDKFYRTDRNLEYFYDGTRWLTTQLFTLPFGDHRGTGTDQFSYASVPYKGVYGVWLEQFQAVTYRSGAAEWDIHLNYRADGTNVDTLIVTLDGAGLPAGVWSHLEATVGVLLDSTAAALVAAYDEVSGSTTYYGQALLHYRLVG